MIDPDLLRGLGWSEDLISEVSRLAEEIRTIARKIPSMHTSYVNQQSEPGNVLYVDRPETDASPSLSVIGSVSDK